MAKARSPGYPVIGLREAIEKVQLIYGEDYQNPIPRLVAAKHMGYNGLNGKSLGVLSALQKYNLLEGRGDDTRVSDLAVMILAHPPGTPERAQAMREAATEPNLFSDLDGRFPDGRASDQAIRSYLLTMKFIPAAADAALRAYRETKQLVDEESRGYTAPELQSGQQVMQVTTGQAGSRFIPASMTGTNTALPASGREIANIRVAKDCAIRLIADGPYSKRSIEALVKNLQLQLSLGSYDDGESLPESSANQAAD